jgi:electron transfer flavoprotein-quinone oxidoreductase
MSFSQYDVVVVGAGAAGLSAAIGLARSGFNVIVVEAAAYPGAENWSGCVYFCENLAHPDLLGPERVETLAWERRLVERGIFATDGYSLLGMTYRDPQAFRQCYTVLRPIYDHHLAQVALRQGVAILTDTTAESLIRDGRRIIGVCTQRGPLYADLVFLAEGDASHLVTREGYERFSDPRETPKFLQGIKQIIDMPEGTIESIFGLGPNEGAAYEILIRNGSLHGRDLHLNMGGFVYTNRQSLSIGLVLPIDNLKENFDGDPNLLLEWFENIPAFKPWLREGKRGVFGAKIIRGGGAKDIPTLVDHGLAIGGAASAIGIDFPYPNFTGPATAMGLLLAQAARRIRDQSGDFSQENLAEHYLKPLQQTHYWQDVEFLRRWPGYVKRTEAFFGLNLDLALGTAYVWTRPRRWLPAKWINWLRLLLNVAGPSQWRLLRQDARHLVRSARLQEVIDRPSWPRLLLDGTINALRDLVGRPRPNLPKAGILGIQYSVAGGAEPTIIPSRLLRRWFRRFAPVLAAAAQSIYSNDYVPLQSKLPEAIRLLIRQINLSDVLLAAGIGMAASITGVLLSGWNQFLKLIGLSRSGKPPRGIYKRYALAARQVADLTPVKPSASQHWEDRLAQLAYQSNKESHIHLLWPRSLPDKDAVKEAGLWHLCPAHVYESRVNPAGQVQVIVNFENCIKCETCWRGSDLVDWARDGRHHFRYEVHSPATVRLFEAVGAAATCRPALPRNTDPWETTVARLANALKTESLDLPNGEDQGLLTEAYQLLSQLDGKLKEFDEALAEEPRTIDRARSEYLEMLARYAQQLAQRLVEIFQSNAQVDRPEAIQAAILEPIAELARALVAKAEERTRRTWTQHFAWAAADGRQMRFHHLPGLRRCLEALTHCKAILGPERVASDDLDPWLRAEANILLLVEKQREWSVRLDAAFPSGFWHELERQSPLTSEQDQVLRELIVQVPPVEPSDFANTLHPPLRKMLLAELGRRDPSLAFRVASHLWARDLIRLQAPAWMEDADRWSRGDEWACLAALKPISKSTHASWQGEALCVPAAATRSIVLLLHDRLAVVSLDHPSLSVAPLRTLGLRGAGLTNIRIQEMDEFETQDNLDGSLLRIYRILASADMISIASGMADQLFRRAIAHAAGRVQFPGLFHDEESRDTIGKFGAIKKMLAEMGARRFVIETMDHVLSPIDISAATENRVSLLKALVVECLGTRPGSLSYNAGQIFGGTGYSEDDMLSKFYRDASMLRFLGQANIEAFRCHGQELLGGAADDQDIGLKETPLFDQIAQRKALQAELDEILKGRSRLRHQIGEWQQTLTRGQWSLTNEPSTIVSDGRKDEVVPAAISAEAEEAVGQLDTELLAGKVLLLRVHARLESGLSNELEIALLRVWLSHTSASQVDCEGLLQRLLRRSPQDDRPIINLAADPPIATYADFLAATAPYDSGDFLIKPTGPAQARMLPELVTIDPTLAERNREFQNLLSERFGKPRQAQELQPRGFETYERYIEQQHRPDDADLDFCRQHSFFRMTIPQELGGEGRPKIDYYLLTTNAQRLADVALSLTIQVNTSIGTTPVLLARDKDLPQARKELEAFIGNANLQREIRAALEKLLKLPALDVQCFTEGFQELQTLLAKEIFSRTVLRALFHRFAESWHQAEKARRDYAPAALRTYLQGALDAWIAGYNGAGEYQGELARRGQACDLFLKWVSSGQISAFALTEPSAGSDTARLATRAHLRSVLVEEQANGSFRFIPAGSKEYRIVLHAERLEFRDRVPHYRWSAADAAPLCFDEYDYDTDRFDRQRYYQADGKKVYFADIAQLRSRAGRLWYDYWELTGAKMWITNGRMAGVMCLYARTDEGVTGFMVDRHAEGLIVGKDEAKMGQCGSPTNELSLQSVRVPRENVIGLEGRGQVNALEALNVGRAGLAMSAMAPMKNLIDSSCDFARGAYGEIPAWAQWRMERMEEARFISEALAYEVIGRFEHSGTRSLRMESAIAKMLTSELLLEVIEHAEEIHGLAGRTEVHLVEKRKRDARVLTIYEGTNEIQSFFILKDLVGELAPRWASSVGSPSGHPSRETLELEALKLRFRQRLESIVTLFGQETWQNPNLQANCFFLSEAAAWLKAADSTLGRIAWLDLRLRNEDSELRIEDRESKIEGRELTGNDAQPSILDPRFLKVGHSALARCYAEIEHRLKRFDEELMHLRRGYYAPEIRVASLLLQEKTIESLTTFSPRPIARPLSILVVMEASAAAIPHPQILNGRLLEAFIPLSESSRSALEAALSIRDQVNSPSPSAFRQRVDGETVLAPVMIQVVAVGTRRSACVLREALSLGVDRVRLIQADSEAVTPARAAAAIAAALGPHPGFDLILAGETAADQEEGLSVRLLAQHLNISFAGSASQLLVHAQMSGSHVVLLDAAGRRQRSRALPAAIAVGKGLSLRDFTTEGYLATVDKNVELIRWPKIVEPGPVELEEGLQISASRAVGSETPPRALAPNEAASRLLHELGLSRVSAPKAAFQGTIEDVANPILLTGAVTRVVGVLGTDAEGRLPRNAPSILKAVRGLATATRAEPLTLLIAPSEESLQRQAIAQCLASGKSDLLLMTTSTPGWSGDILGQMLIDCWPDYAVMVRAMVGESWSELAFAALANKQRKAGLLALRIRQIQIEQGKVILVSSRSDGKLQARLAFDLRFETAPWISLTDEAEIRTAPEMMADAPSPRSLGQEHAAEKSIVVQRWKPQLPGRQTGAWEQLLGEVKQDLALARLAEADFIVDVGFGVGNRDGYEAVIEPLERALREVGVRNLAIGGSRKVTEELHLLPADRQIGQSGVSVNPQLLLAIGISGAPQHLNYIGRRATILAFNRDPEAPIMTLNQRQSRPRVFPIVGNLFETVPAFITALRNETSAHDRKPAGCPS